MKKFIRHGSDQKKYRWTWLQDIIYNFQLPNPVVELRNILIKSMGIEVVAKNHLQPPKTMFLPQIILKITI